VDAAQPRRPRGGRVRGALPLLRLHRPARRHGGRPGRARGRAGRPRQRPAEGAPRPRPPGDRPRPRARPRRVQRRRRPDDREAVLDDRPVGGARPPRRRGADGPRDRRPQLVLVAAAAPQPRGHRRDRRARGRPLVPGLGHVGAGPLRPPPGLRPARRRGRRRSAR
jgi:hypothetical protein